MSAIAVGTLLKNIGISGWADLEPAIFAALKTRTPINLIGDKGTSKTEFCYRMSLALQGQSCKFQKYDTPDATMDQILGFMNLEAMKTGQVDFIKTGTSIWHKTSVLWDEINRVSPMTQGKLLEVIRSGTIHGLPTEVEFQFGTCNPPRATGTSVGHNTYYLDEALASRFFHVHVPKTSVQLFDEALALSDVRNAFASGDMALVKKYCTDLGKFWFEYDHEKPTKEEADAAAKIVRAALSETTNSKKGMDFFDMRAALRATKMLSELFCMHRLYNLESALIPSVEKVICGNIVEFNGVIRNDRSGDKDAVLNTVLAAARALLKGAFSTGATVVLASEPFKLTQKCTLDEANLQPIHNALAKAPTQANFEQAVSGFVKKQNTDDKYRNMNFRSAHKNALAMTLAQAKQHGINSMTIKYWPASQPAELKIDLESESIADVAKKLHDTWYVNCGLGKTA